MALGIAFTVAADADLAFSDINTRTNLLAPFGVAITIKPLTMVIRITSTNFLW